MTCSNIAIQFAGAQLGNFERGRRYIYDKRDEIIYDLSQSAKCVTPLFRDIIHLSVKCRYNADAPSAPPLSCTPEHHITKFALHLQGVTKLWS